MNILGINAYHGDVSTVLIRDGHLIAALEALLGPARRPEEPLEDRHRDVACSLQVVYETCLFHILRDLWERTRNPRLCLAGGCAMNSVANGKVRANTPFEEVYIQPAAADNGTALGAAYHVYNQSLGKPRGFVMEHAYWGTEYPDAPGPALASRIDARNDEDAEWEYTLFAAPVGTGIYMMGC